MNLSNQIKNKALEIGFSKIGIAKAQFYEQDANNLNQWLSKGFHGSMDWIKNRKVERENIHKYYRNLILKLKKLNIKILTVPFYGNNKITKSNYINFLNFINFLCTECSKSRISLCIESNITPDLFFSLKKKIKKKLYFKFDTGNRVLVK